MILRFRQRGLERFFGDDDQRGLNAQHVEKIATILAQLDRAAKPEDMAIPGFGLHPLRGDLRGFWSVTVRANWRIVFRFGGQDATDVTLVDYH